MPQKFRFLVLCLGISFNLIAGDASRCEVIGFSKDGAFFAFERYGSQDGSGFPYSEIFILDICKNDYAAKPFRLTDQEEGSSEEKTRSSNLKKAMPTLTKFGILNGNVGTKTMPNETDSPGITFQFKNKKAKIILLQQETGNSCDDILKERKLTVTLDYTGGVKVLQKDNQLPKSRACASSYGVEAVFCYANALVAIIAYQAPGFEGPDTRQIAVSVCIAN